jgi:hypothetical protein
MRRSLVSGSEGWRSAAGVADSEHGKETRLEIMGIKHLIMDQSLGELAYAAYCEAVGYKSVRGDTLPGWADQDERLQEAWDAAAEAVADYLEKS